MFLTLLLKFWWAPVIGVVFLYGQYWHHETKAVRKDLAVVQAEYDGFKSKVEALGAQAKENAEKQEKANEDRIRDAKSGRDAALNQLQLAQARAASAGSRGVSNNPVAPAGRSEICISSPAYNAAFQQFGADLTRFLQETGGYAYEGDSANIDASALIQAWPITKR